MKMVLIPHISEKAITQAEQGTYVFDVPTSANKIEVGKAVEQAFNVKVRSVNVLLAKGKAVQWRQRGGKRTPGRRNDTKKALVRLSEGKINLFDEGSK